MSARRIDGRAHAEALRGEVRRSAETFRAHVGRAPGLAVVLVGDDPASQVYVRNKDRAATEAGFDVRTLRLEANTPQALLLGVVRELNRDESIDGILVQLPLPAHLDAGQVLRALDPAKDVDGLHPENVAALWAGGRGLVPCTPAGCVTLLEREGIAIEGRRAVVLGRSLLVGKPLAALLLERNATVTLAHSRSRNLPELCREAEILVAAVGKAELVRGDWVRPGAAVLDVGINRREDGGLVGDVAFSEVEPHAGWITPVPGGVGPMTIAMLLRNTYLAGARAAELDPVELVGPGARR